MLKLLLQIIFFVVFSFTIKAVDITEFLLLNSEYFDETNKNEWILIEDKNYIPYLNFKKIEYNNFNKKEPDLSIYLDSLNESYREHYYFINYEDNFVGRTYLTYFFKDKFLSQKDEIISIEESINLFFPKFPNDFNKIQKCQKSRFLKFFIF